MPRTAAADAGDCCDVCLVEPRHARIALVVCWHRCFCTSCASEVYNQQRGRPICRAPINMYIAASVLT